MIAKVFDQNRIKIKALGSFDILRNTTIVNAARVSAICASHIVVWPISGMTPCEMDVSVLDAEYQNIPGASYTPLQYSVIILIGTGPRSNENSVPVNCFMSPSL